MRMLKARRVKSQKGDILTEIVASATIANAGVANGRNIPVIIVESDVDGKIDDLIDIHKAVEKENKHFVYTTMLIDGTLNHYLANINQQAEQMFHRLIEEMAKKQGVAEQPMEWIGLMNNIQVCAREIVNNEIIFV